MSYFTEAVCLNTGKSHFHCEQPNKSHINKTLKKIDQTDKKKNTIASVFKCWYKIKLHHMHWYPSVFEYSLDMSCTEGLISWWKY